MALSRSRASRKCIINGPGSPGSPGGCAPVDFWPRGLGQQPAAATAAARSWRVPRLSSINAVSGSSCLCWRSGGDGRYNIVPAKIWPQLRGFQFSMRRRVSPFRSPGRRERRCRRPRSAVRHRASASAPGPMRDACSSLRAWRQQILPGAAVCGARRQPVALSRTPSSLRVGAVRPERPGGRPNRLHGSVYRTLAVCCTANLLVSRKRGRASRDCSLNLSKVLSFENRS